MTRKQRKTIETVHQNQAIRTSKPSYMSHKIFDNNLK